MYKLRTLFILIFILTISILTFSKSKPETSSDNFYELKKINQIFLTAWKVWAKMHGLLVKLGVVMMQTLKKLKFCLNLNSGFAF